MQTTIGALNVPLTLNPGAFVAGAQKGREALSALAANSRTSLAIVDRSLTQTTVNITRMARESLSLGNVFRSALGVAGIGIGTAALTAFSKKIFDTTAGLIDQARQVNSTVEGLQALRAVLEDNGGAAADADNLLRKLTVSVGAAEEGAGSARDAFAKLGLGAKDMAGSSEQVLGRVARALLAIPDAAVRARIETELFGKSGQVIEASLSDLANGLDNLTTKYKEQGRVISDELAVAAKKAQDDMVKGWAQLEVSVAPAIIRLTTLLAGLASALSNVGSAGPSGGSFPWSRALEGAAAGAIGGSVIPGVGTVAGGALGFGAGMVHGYMYPGATNSPWSGPFAGSDSVGIAAQGSSAASAGRYQTQAEEKSAKEAVDAKFAAANNARQFEDRIKNLVTGDISKTNSRVMPSAMASISAMQTGAGAIKSDEVVQQGQIIIDIKNLWDGYYDQQAQRQQQYFDTVSAIEDNAFNNISDLLIRGGNSWRDYAQVAISAIRDIISEQMKLANNDNSSGIGSLLVKGIGSLFGGGASASSDMIDLQIPGRAGGGPVAAGSTYMVGENGPELFTAGSNGSITPNGGGQGVHITIDPSPLFAAVMKTIKSQAVSESVGAVHVAVRNRGGRF